MIENLIKDRHKEEFKSYLWNTNLDIDVDELKDNLNRPLNDLYLTIFQTNRNLMWHYEAPANSPAGYGWEWNFRHNGFIDPFVDNNTNPTNLFQNNFGKKSTITDHSHHYLILD